MNSLVISSTLVAGGLSVTGGLGPQAALELTRTADQLRDCNLIATVAEKGSQGANWIEYGLGKVLEPAVRVFQANPKAEGALLMRATEIEIAVEQDDLLAAHAMRRELADELDAIAQGNRKILDEYPFDWRQRAAGPARLPENPDRLVAAFPVSWREVLGADRDRMPRRFFYYGDFMVEVRRALKEG